jgi:hypothetical protein
MRLRGILAGAGLGAATMLATPVAASAAWDAGSAGTSLSVRAAVLPVSLAPSVDTHGSSLSVRWPAVAGYPVRGYRLFRFNAVTHAATAVSDGCASLLHQTHCTDHDVPAGWWDYRVVAVVGDNWTTPPSAPVTVQVSANAAERDGAPGKPAADPAPGPADPALGPADPALGPVDPAGAAAPSEAVPSLPMSPTEPATSSPSAKPSPTQPATPSLSAKPSPTAKPSPATPSAKPSPATPSAKPSPATPSAKPMPSARPSAETDPNAKPEPSAKPEEKPSPAGRPGESTEG